MEGGFLYKIRRHTSPIQCIIVAWLFFCMMHNESVSILTEAQKVLKSKRHTYRLADIMKLVQEGEKNFGFNSNFQETVNINFQSNEFLPGTTLFAKKSLLNMAIIHQRRHVMEWLVDKKKVNVNSCGDGEFSPLIYAAYGGNLKLVEYLLSRGADECKLDFLGSWIIWHKYLHRRCSLMLKDGH